uniref:Uncharacterized protein n=1 Tax=Panagrolaimus sp. JU765 TaxID=591449 RepID=A0AC34PV04_9BILA
MEKSLRDKYLPTLLTINISSEKTTLKFHNGEPLLFLSKNNELFQTAIEHNIVVLFTGPCAMTDSQGYKFNKNIVR